MRLNWSGHDFQYNVIDWWKWPWYYINIMLNIGQTRSFQTYTQVHIGCQIRSSSLITSHGAPQRKECSSKLSSRKLQNKKHCLLTVYLVGCFCSISYSNQDISKSKRACISWSVYRIICLPLLWLHLYAEWNVQIQSAATWFVSREKSNFQSF